MIDDKKYSKTVYRRASLGKRFVNFLIDFLACFLVLIFVEILLSILETKYGNQENLYRKNEIEIFWVLMEYLFASIIIITYYVFCEFIFSGKTIGKYFTKTRAVTKHSQIMNFNVIVLRNFCRMIPFEIISFLGGDGLGWHDLFSDTIVIDETSYFEIEFS